MPLQRFLWIPGQGPDKAALARLRDAFPRPSKPMGEAWFMGERKMYPELLGDLSSLSAWDLQKPLEEIAGGTCSFGAMDEWRDWYHYLLGQLVPRAHESFVYSVLETLVSGFVSQYPNCVHRPPYPRFLEDSLLTLGRCMMDPANWRGSDLVLGSMLRRSNNNPNRIWLWDSASGDFSASMFFCLKYLPEPLKRDWLESVLAIESPYWRAQVLVWLIGSEEMLGGRIQWPSQFRSDVVPAVFWDGSHCLDRELAQKDESGAARFDAFLPEQTCTQVLATVRGHFSRDEILRWRRSIGAVPALVDELGELPDVFERMVARPH